MSRNLTIPDRFDHRPKRAEAEIIAKDRAAIKEFSRRLRRLTPEEQLHNWLANPRKWLGSKKNFMLHYSPMGVPLAPGYTGHWIKHRRGCKCSYCVAVWKPVISRTRNAHADLDQLEPVTITISRAAYNRLVRLILCPPKPNKRLRKVWSEAKARRWALDHIS